MKFVNFNANYWNRATKDCVIRAFCMAIQIGYAALCSCFGKKFEWGWGYGRERGISQEEVDKFVERYGSRFQITEVAPTKFRKLQDAFMETEVSLEFILESGIFDEVLKEEGLDDMTSFVGIVRVSRKEGITSKIDDYGFHAVYFCRTSDGWKFFDIPEKATTMNAVPLAIYAVGYKFPTNNKHQYFNEKQACLEYYNKYIKSKKTKEPSEGK